MASKLPPGPDFESLEAAAAASHDHRTETVTAIGRLVYSWSNNESMFIHLLMLLMDTDEQTAVLVFLTLNTTRARLDLANRLARVKIADPQLREELGGIMERFNKATKTRNEFNHCMYTLDDKGAITHTHSLRIIESKKGLRLGERKPMDRKRMAEIEATIRGLTVLNRDIWHFLPRLESHLRQNAERAG